MQLDYEKARSIQVAANMLGVAPEDLATVIAYETIGTFDPGIKGGMNKDGSGKGTFKGLIQFSPWNQKHYGVKPNMSFHEQVTGPVVDYLRGEGVKPGMGIEDIYSTVLTGAPGNYNRSDVNGSVRQHVSRMKKNYGPRIQQTFDVLGSQSAALNEFVGQTEAAGRVQPLPVDTSLQGLFDTPALPGVDGGTPTEREGIPIARRDNPANPTFSDNSVGRLQNKDYGYQTARTVGDLMSVLGGPQPPGVTASASGQGLFNRQEAAGAADLSGLFSEQPTDFSAVQPTMSDDLQLGTPVDGQELADLQRGPSQRLGPRNKPRQIASVPTGRLDQSFGLFDDPQASVAATSAQPVAPETPVPVESVPASPLQPIASAQTIAPRQVTQPQPSRPTYRNDLVPNVAPSVAENINQYDLPNEGGYSYGYSPFGSGVARVYDNADERTKIAASGSGLFGAFNDEFGTNIGLGPGKMMAPLATALGAGAATLGAGPLALAIPAANALGGTNWLANKLDVVPQSQRVNQPRPQQPGLMSRLFGGNPLQGFAGGLFDAPQKAAQAVGGLFGGGDQGGNVSFNGPLGRNQSSMNPANLSEPARQEIERATRGLY